MSRLINNSEEYRNRIESRNLYTPETPYRLEEGNITQAINSIGSVLSPFSSPDIDNSIIGRLASPINTPIQQIGLQMLAKQFGHTARSLAAAEYLPSTNFANLFDGNPNTKLFTSKVDFQITRRETQSSIGKILEEITGVYRPVNSFQDSPTNLDYFRQTGKGQQILLVNALNKSAYKPSSSAFQSAVAGAGIEFSKTTESAPRIYFAGLNTNLYPYSRFYDFGSIVTRPAELNRRLNTQKQSFIETFHGENSYEYGASQRYLDGFGNTRKTDNSDGAGNYRIDDQSFGLPENLDKKIIWGRDGIDSNYEKIVKGFDGELEDRNQVPSEKALDGDTTNTEFNQENNRFFSTDRPRTGLLNYTKELLNSRGKYGNFDLTKKKFIDKDDNVFFNGMPLTQNPAGDIDRSRQHNVTDPYDRYVKAIRFKGNEVYGGSQYSTIHKHVLPKIAPSLGENGKVDIKNLMFSIENLAVSVTEDGFLDDANNGVQLPDCEIGNQGGRLMWFAPYDLKLSEQSVAKHESTQFLGRSEPIYTYNSTERLASLSFKLLVDYPPQLKADPELQTQSQAARFMAFGSKGKLPKPVDIGQKEKEKEVLIQQRDELKPDKEVDTTVNAPVIPKISFYFPNDIPIIGSESSGVGFTLGSNYEDGDVDNDAYEKDFSLNVGFVNAFDEIVTRAFDQNNRGNYVLYLTGYATKLFRGEAAREYNINLSSRRIEAVKTYLNERYSDLYDGRSLEQDGIKIIANPEGDINADSSTSLESNISTLESKSNRRVDVEFRKIFKRLQPRGINDDLRQNTQRDTNILSLNTRITQLEKEIADAKNAAKKGFECTFNQYTIKDGIFKGFEATQRQVNKFLPVFHSQTPEDFHRRLTFLQQCVRQGSAVRREKKTDNGNLFTADNAVFGRQPVQILRLGDFFNTKVIIDNIQFEYGDAPWDLNPEGMGMQFMYADVTMQLKIIGGMSMRGPIDALQNAVSFNYYANSTFYNDGVYAKATAAETAQQAVNDDVNTNGENKNESN